jgi:hypothetical protein
MINLYQNTGSVYTDWFTVIVDLRSITCSTTKACDGPCSGKTCCTSKCSGGSQVCGANGKDYDSECLAICE